MLPQIGARVGVGFAFGGGWDDDGVMRHAIWIWVLRGAAILVLGPIAGMLANSMRAVDGSGHATMLLSSSIVRGVFVVLAIGFMAQLIGIVATRVLSLREGVLNAGFVLAWGACLVAVCVRAIGSARSARARSQSEASRLEDATSANF